MNLKGHKTVVTSDSSAVELLRLALSKTYVMMAAIQRVFSLQQEV